MNITKNFNPRDVGLTDHTILMHMVAERHFSVVMTRELTNKIYHRVNSGPLQELRTMMMMITNNIFSTL